MDLTIGFLTKTMIVTVEKADGLKADDEGMWGPGSSDPYCKMRHAYPLNGTYETEVVNENLSPTWSKCTFGPIPWIPDRPCEFEVFDSDALGSDDSIGKVSVTPTGQDSQQWYPLAHQGKKAGKLHVKFAFTDIDYSQWKAVPRPKAQPAVQPVSPPAPTPVVVPAPVPAAVDDTALREALAKNRELEDENERLRRELDMVRAEKDSLASQLAGFNNNAERNTGELEAELQKSKSLLAMLRDARLKAAQAYA